MSTKRQDIMIGVTSTVLAAVCLGVIGWGAGIVKFYGAKAANAASVERVDNLESRIEKMPDGESIRKLNSQLSDLNDILISIRMDLRSTRETQDEQGRSLQALWQRHRYVWDSVTMICTKIEIMCATRDASVQFPGIPPWPETPSDAMAAVAVMTGRKSGA